MLRDALLENLHRQQLDPLEEAAAYQQLLDDFGATHEQLAQKVGRSRPHISNTLRLLNLPPAVQKKLAAGVISAGHARAMLPLDAPAQERLAQRIVAEGLSVRTSRRSSSSRDDKPEKQPRKPALREASRPRPAPPVRPPLRPLRDPRQGRDGPQQGQDHRRVRHDRRPRAHRKSDVPGGRLQLAVTAGLTDLAELIAGPHGPDGQRAADSDQAHVATRRARPRSTAARRASAAEPAARSAAPKAI